MRPCVLTVGADRRERGALRHRNRLRHLLPAHMGGEGVAGREQAERLAIARIDRDGLFQQRLRHQIVLPGHAPVMLQRAHHQIPGVHVVRRLALGAEILGRIELRSIAATTACVISSCTANTSLRSRS